MLARVEPIQLPSLADNQDFVDPGLVHKYAQMESGVISEMIQAMREKDRLSSHDFKAYLAMAAAQQQNSGTVDSGTHLGAFAKMDVHDDGSIIKDNKAGDIDLSVMGDNIIQHVNCNLNTQSNQTDCNLPTAKFTNITTTNTTISVVLTAGPKSRRRRNIIIGCCSGMLTVTLVLALILQRRTTTNITTVNTPETDIRLI